MANWQHLVASGKLAPRNTRARGNTLPRSIGTTSISLNVYDDFTRVCQVVRRVNRRNMRDD